MQVNDNLKVSDDLKPVEVTGLDMAFGPRSIRKLMPAYEDIPEEFRRGHTKWNGFFNDMFFSGIKNLNLIPKEGIDHKAALCHIKALSGSFEPKHEHKEAAVAYLMSIWFQDGSTWERAK